MHERPVVDGERVGQTGEPGLRVRRDSGAGPLHRPPRVDVEHLDLVAAGRRGVVIAAHAGRADLTLPRDDAVRVRPIADDVAQLPDAVHRPGIGEDGVEGDKIRMDVREHEGPHRRAA